VPEQELAQVVAETRSKPSSLELQALLAPGIKTILIRGAPGAGKTTAALELLRFAGGVYVSTHTPEERLVDHHPWLRGAARGTNIIEAGRREARIKIWEVPQGASVQILEETRAAARSEPVVVLDLWNAVAQHLPGEGRLRAEKDLLDAVAGTEGRLVFVTDELGLTSTEFVCDATLNLTDGEFEGRRLRQAEWTKLRGQFIPRKRTPYSLAEARFHLIPPLEMPTIQHPARFAPIAHLEDRYSTGSRDLDAFLGGGLRKASFVLLEIGKTVGPDWHLPMMTSIRCNFLVNGGCIFATASGGSTSRLILDAMKLHVDPALMESRVTIVSEREVAEQSSVTRVSEQTLETRSKAISGVIRELKGIKANRPCCLTLSIDGEELRRGSRAALKLALDVLAKVRATGDVAIALVTPSTTITQSLSDVCDLHLQLEEVNGCLLLYGKRPPTILHAVTYDYSNGYPQVQLTPLV
jgi:KaiC/GvpD/RAD55 family RecA-like ATPase